MGHFVELKVKWLQSIHYRHVHYPLVWLCASHATAYCVVDRDGIGTFPNLL